MLKKEFKVQRTWCKENLPKEKINPHDPVNGAYSDTEINYHIDNTLINISLKRSEWLSKEKDSIFIDYSADICRAMALISSRRAAQLCQSKVCDLNDFATNDENIQIDKKLISILFYKSKINNSGFRAEPEGDFFPFAEVLSHIILDYLEDYQLLLKKYCNNFDIEFKELPWEYYPIFPEILLIKSKRDLTSPNLHTDRLHRNLGSVITSATFSINRVRHATITRGMELGLNEPELARLTGVTIPSVRNYKDLTPQSRQMINDRFCKNNLLRKSFSWTLKDFNEHFNKTYTDELGRNLGGIKNEVGCSNCPKKLGAPLGCYACGADLFIPFIEGDHKSQLFKAENKKKFLVNTGASHHQLFEIKMIIDRIEQVITAQNLHNKNLQKT